MTATGSRSPLVSCVRLAWSEETLEWTHWGRPINQFRLGSLSSEAGRNRGYHRDLLKMLILAASDKDARETGVTGKFGLGFKSVFLLSDRPKVLSGQLGFEVVGGFFPKRLDAHDYSRLSNHLGTQEGAPCRGTLIELPLDNRIVDEVESTVGRFRQLVPLFLVFARRIKRCQIAPPGAEEETRSWAETPVCGCTHVLMGSLDLSSVPKGALTHAVILRSADGYGGLLIPVGSEGFRKLPEDVPTVWVTAPTGENLNVGFAVNGEFALDIGRAQLARDAEENDQAVRELGREFGSALCQLFDASQEDRASFADALRLASDTSDYELWWSLWELLASELVRPSVAGTSTGRLLRRMLWSHGHGMQRLVNERRALPTGLWASHRCLTDIDSVRGVAQGALDSDEELFVAVSGWERVNSRLQPGQVVSHSRVAAKLRDLTGEEDYWQPLTLQTAVEWQLSTALQVSTDEAILLGEVVTLDLLRKLQWGSVADRSEYAQLRRLLDGLEFRAKDGACRPAGELLVSALHSDDADEALRAAFAPDRHVLDASYRDEAVEFFRVCREQLRAPAAMLAQWGLDADTKDKQAAFRRYLLEGELSTQVSSIAYPRRKGTWLEDASDLYDAEVYRRDARLQLLGVAGAVATIQIEGFQTRALWTCEEIHDWWCAHSHTETAEYVRKTYPDGQSPAGTEVAPQDLDERVQWLKLFLLGVLHTQAWPTPERGRNFARFCHERGWLQEMAASAEGSQGWLRSWEWHIDQQVQEIGYYRAMQQLVGLYVIARHLNDYVDALLAINRMTRDFSLAQVFAPRASEHFRGGGPDAPPILDILGIGAHFVLRELARSGVLTNQLVHRHCYVPGAGVRQLGVDGWPDLPPEVPHEDASVEIYRFLLDRLGEEKATFGGAFDIALRSFAKAHGPDAGED